MEFLSAAVLGLALLVPSASVDSKPGDLDGDQVVTILDLCHLYDVVLGPAAAGPLDDLDGDSQGADAPVGRPGADVERRPRGARRPRRHHDTSRTQASYASASSRAPRTRSVSAS